MWKRFVFLWMFVALALCPLPARAVGLVEVHVVDNGNISGLTVEISRSIAGQAPDYSMWQATTDDRGHAVVTVIADALSSVNGMYQARVRSTDGEIIARWSSIPLTPGRLITYEIDLSGNVRFINLTTTDTSVPAIVPAMMTSQDGWNIMPLFTVGESVNGYIPPGILDGIGAIKMGNRRVRVYVNHELYGAIGYAYSLKSGARLAGARVSYFDINSMTRQLMGAGLAYDTIIGANGQIIRNASQLNSGLGLRRLCSSALFQSGEYGLVDDIYFTGEEVSSGGLEYALDVKNGVLYALPWLGKAAWENVTLLDTGSDRVAVLAGDDRTGAPLILYMGTKMSGGFVQRNGLANGELYVWVADNGDRDPDAWNGTGTSRTGKFIKIDHYDASRASTMGYDALGFATQSMQDALADGVGTFKFSRPEDVSTNPEDGTQAVLASTGRGQLFASDDWGTTYLIDIDFSNLSAKIDILYDGDDAGGGQFSDSDFGLRSPDNLDWADNGMIYINEDRSTKNNTFGGVSNIEASIWELNPNNGQLTRIAVVNRSVLPPGQTDSDPDDLGDWETSGVLDVTGLFDTQPGERLLITNIQAHSIYDGIIKSEGLIQGGQMVLMSKIESATKLAAKPPKASLGQNHPNPFNPTTTIRYSLREATDVRLAIYNILGQEIRLLVRHFQPVGNYTVVWDGRNEIGREVSTGIYLYRLQAGSDVLVHKMLLTK